MLSDRKTKLLSESIDRVLTPKQRRKLEKLLAQDAKARELLEQLKRDSQEIYDLPKLKLPENFPEQILKLIESRHALADRNVRPMSPAAPARTLPAWAGVAIAASVLILVGLSTFWYFRRTDAPPAIVESDTTRSAPPRTSPKTSKDSPKSTEKEKKPIQRPFDRYALVGKPKSTIPHRDGQELANELQTRLVADRGHHVSVETKSPSQTFKRIAKALSDNKVRVLQSKSKKSAQSAETAHWLVILGNIKAVDARTLLAAIAFDPGTEKSAGLVTRLDHTELTKAITDQIAKDFRLKLLAIELPKMVQGVEPVTPKTPQPVKVDPDPGPFAIVLAYVPGATAHAPATREIQDFLRQQQHQPGCVQIVLVLHRA
jgi:hypothetical protein